MEPASLRRHGRVTGPAGWAGCQPWPHAAHGQPRERPLVITAQKMLPMYCLVVTARQMRR